jgi:probable HAF family extracellular repeat protein
VIRWRRIPRLLSIEEHNMKSIVTAIAAGSLLAALALAEPPRPRYTVKDLGTLGGDTSFAFQINDAGWVAGSANLTAGGPQHAFLWYGTGPLHDLGTLGGPNSAADGPNLFGEAAIGSETSISLGPNGEDFCAFGTHRQCLGAIWRNGHLTALPSLVGGQSSANAFGVNDLGQVVGFAENGVHDTTCLAGGTPFQVTQFEAVIWGLNGQIRELPPLKGDTVAFAFAINDFGQAIGSSGLCSNTAIPPTPAGPHAVLWERDGSAINLGSLGGATNIASSINNLGQVVGGAQSPKDGTIHAFLWTRATGMQDFGAFPGAIVTVPGCCNTLNNRGEMVGFAIDGTTFNSRALVWQGKTPVDLNTLIPKGSPWYLQAADSVNDFGEIVGQGLINGKVHAFVATPTNRDFGDESFSDAAESASSPMVVPEDVRNLLQQRPRFGRFGTRLMEPR